MIRPDNPPTCLDIFMTGFLVFSLIVCSGALALLAINEFAPHLLAVTTLPLMRMTIRLIAVLWLGLISIFLISRLIAFLRGKG